MPFDSTSQGDEDELKSFNLMEAQAEHEILVLDSWTNFNTQGGACERGAGKKRRWDLLHFSNGVSSVKGSPCHLSHIGIRYVYNYIIAYRMYMYI